MFINGKTNFFLQHTYLKMLSKGVEKILFQIISLWCSPTYSKGEGFTMVEKQCFRQEEGSSNSYGAICLELEKACGKPGCQGRLQPDGRESTECLAEHLESPL